MCPVQMTARDRRVRGDPLAAIDVDLIVVPWFEDETPTRCRARRGQRRRDWRERIVARNSGRALRPVLDAVADRSWRAAPRRVVGAGPRADCWHATSAEAGRGRRVGGPAERRRGLGLRRPRRAGPRRARAGGRRRVDAGGVQRRQLQDGRAAPAPPPAWTVVVDGAASRRTCRQRWRADASSASAATWRASSPTSRATR